MDPYAYSPVCQALGVSTRRPLRAEQGEGGERLRSIGRGARAVEPGTSVGLGGGAGIAVAVAVAAAVAASGRSEGHPIQDGRGEARRCAAKQPCLSTGGDMTRSGTNASITVAPVPAGVAGGPHPALPPRLQENRKAQLGAGESLLQLQRVPPPPLPAAAPLPADRTVRNGGGAGGTAPHRPRKRPTPPPIPPEKPPSSFPPTLRGRFIKWLCSSRRRCARQRRSNNSRGRRALTRRGLPPSSPPSIAVLHVAARASAERGGWGCTPSAGRSRPSHTGWTRVSAAAAAAGLRVDTVETEEEEMSARCLAVWQCTAVAVEGV